VSAVRAGTHSVRTVIDEGRRFEEKRFVFAAFAIVEAMKNGRHPGVSDNGQGDTVIAMVHPVVPTHAVLADHGTIPFKDVVNGHGSLQTNSAKSG
jgi:hypothetical protein